MNEPSLSLLTTFVVTVLGATVAGLLVLGIRKYAPIFWRLATRFVPWLRTVICCSRPGLKLGLSIDEREMGVSWEGRSGVVQLETLDHPYLKCEIYAVAQDRRSPVLGIPSPKHPQGEKVGWELPALVGGHSSLLRFPKKHSRFLRRFKGGERIIVVGTVSQGQVYSDKGLLGYDCKIVAGWRDKKAGRWLRIAGRKRKPRLAPRTSAPFRNLPSP